MGDYNLNGNSISNPLNKTEYKDIFNRIGGGAEKSSMPFLDLSGRNGDIDTKLVDDIQNVYSQILDDAGMNFADSLSAYSTNFNTNMQTTGLDPQRGGTSFSFFTRPDLNLNSTNLKLIPFLDWVSKTEIGKMVCDRLMYPNTAGEGIGSLKQNYRSDSRFNILKTNVCKSVDGMKDMVLEAFETEGDLNGTQMTFSNGGDGIESIGEFTAAFNDPIGSPIWLEHFVQYLYQHHVVKGTIAPKYKYLVNKIIDYTCSVYTFRLAEDHKTILRWSKLTGCWPTNVPMGSLNHSNEVKNDDLEDVTITYKANAYEPMNPRALADFNITSTANLLQSDLPAPGATKNTLDLMLKGRKEPERLLEAVLKNKENHKNRTDEIWSGGPIVVGNQLIWT